jgi:hypothetical protein
MTPDARLRAIHASIWFFGILQLAFNVALLLLVTR